MPPRETPILHSVRAALAARDDVLVHRNNVGVDTVRGVRYGIGVGSTDLVGVLTVRGVGVALYVEVKTPTGKLTAEQRLFRDAMIKRGAVHIVARSAAEAIDGIELARNRIQYLLGNV